MRSVESEPPPIPERVQLQVQAIRPFGIIAAVNYELSEKFPSNDHNWQAAAI